MAKNYEADENKEGQYCMESYYSRLIEPQIKMFDASYPGNRGDHEAPSDMMADYRNEQAGP